MIQLSSAIFAFKGGKNMTYMLVKMNKDYADEFDVKGFFCCTLEQWNEYKTAAYKMISEHPEQEYYFGSNEFLEFDSSHEFDEAFVATEISDAEYETMMKLFGSPYATWVTFGFTPDF